MLALLPLELGDPAHPLSCIMQSYLLRSLSQQGPAELLVGPDDRVTLGRRIELQITSLQVSRAHCQLAATQHGLLLTCLREVFVVRRGCVAPEHVQHSWTTLVSTPQLMPLAASQSAPPHPSVRLPLWQPGSSLLNAVTQHCSGSSCN